MSVEYNGLRFERLGHASVRIETDEGTVAYIDPWSEVIDDGRGDADVVFVTHDDFDHYDPDGIEAVSSSDTVVVAYEAIDTSDLDRDVTHLAYDGEARVRGFDVTAVPAYNDPDGDHTDDTGAPFHAESEVIGLLLQVAGVRILFTSDTDVIPVHEGISADVLIPPIGGHYTMDRHQAADLAEMVGASLVLPVHYDTFDAIETDADAFEEDVEARGIDVELF